MSQYFDLINIILIQSIFSKTNLSNVFQPVLLPPDTRTEQEQANDLLKQYMEQTNIESKYKNEFDDMIKDMESRMNKLKGINSSSSKEHDLVKSTEDAESENEEESVRKIVEKVFKFFFTGTDVHHLRDLFWLK